MTTGEKIRMLRKQMGLTQDDLASYADTKKQTIHKYETGIIQNIPASKIKLLAERLNTTPAFLMGWDEKRAGIDFNNTDNTPSNITPINNDIQIINIPVIGRVAAGLNCFVEDNILDYEPVIANEISHSEKYAFLKVIGDSMYPEMKEGDLVLVRCQASVDSGEYAVVIIDDEDGVVKRVVYDTGYIELQSINPMYPPRRFEDREVLRVRIFGLVQKIVRNY